MVVLILFQVHWGLQASVQPWSPGVYGRAPELYHVTSSSRPIISLGYLKPHYSGTFSFTDVKLECLSLQALFSLYFYLSAFGDTLPQTFFQCWLSFLGAEKFSLTNPYTYFHSLVDSFIYLFVSSCNERNRMFQHSCRISPIQKYAFYFNMIILKILCVRHQYKVRFSMWNLRGDQWVFWNLDILIQYLVRGWLFISEKCCPLN